MEANTQTILIVFVALTGAAVLMQALVLLGIFISLRKTAKSVAAVTEDVKTTVIPMVHTTRELLERITPQVTTISSGLAELVELVHKESSEVRVSVGEIMGRVSRQTARLDAMLTVGLDKVEQTASTLEAAAALPVRQANGIFSALKAALNAYRTTTPRKAAYPDPDIDPVSDPDHDILV
jgi:hypothetical protein